MSKVKWGILGAARVNERLLPAIIEASNAELVAIASRRAGAAKATLDKYAPCHQNVICYDDMDALIHDKTSMRFTVRWRTTSTQNGRLKPSMQVSMC